MLNIEKYKDKIEKIYYERQEIYSLKKEQNLGSAIFEVYDDLSDYSADADDVIEWLCDECKEPLLTSCEYLYIESLLEPLSYKYDEVTIKVDDKFNFGERLIITFKDADNTYMMALPPFEKETMYKGLVRNVEYSLEDLEL